MSTTPSPSPFTTLPSEILHNILSYLPIVSLLSFASTSKENHLYHRNTLHTLHLAVFPKKVQSLIAFLQQQSTTTSPLDKTKQISITLRELKPSKNSTPKSFRNRVISSQNAHLTSLLSRYGPFLQTLTFHAWDFLPEPASALATQCPSLKNLSLSFDHSASRDPCIPSGYFDTPPSLSALWNALAGLGEKAENALVLRNLASLRINRAGITSAQLRRIVTRNPGLTDLHLRKVSGVDNEFVEWLGGEQNARRGALKVLALEECPELKGGTEDSLEWVNGLTFLQTLSFDGCSAVDGELVRDLNERRWGIKDLVGWGGNWREGGLQVDVMRNDGFLEVDEACL